MKENIELTPPHQEKNLRLGIWTGFIISIVYLIFFGFSIFIVITQGYFFWTDTLLMVLTGLAWVSGFAGIALIRKGRYILGTGLVYVVNILPPVAAAISLQYISLVTSSYILLSSFFFFLL